jgi:hypothetical protein
LDHAGHARAFHSTSHLLFDIARTQLSNVYYEANILNAWQALHLAGMALEIGTL